MSCQIWLWRILQEGVEEKMLAERADLQFHTVFLHYSSVVLHRVCVFVCVTLAQVTHTPEYLHHKQEQRTCQVIHYPPTCADVMYQPERRVTFIIISCDVHMLSTHLQALCLTLRADRCVLGFFKEGVLS